nr:hypothetical protein [Tanacetum cinerariifolium]
MALIPIEGYEISTNTQEMDGDEQAEITRKVKENSETFISKELEKLTRKNDKLMRINPLQRQGEDDELDKMSRVLYASATGSIMYTMTCTRPDVSFALSMVSRHQQNLDEGHWTIIKNILSYLRNTKDRFLVYGGEKELRVTGYCDAGKSSKQDTVADSTCESEHIVACESLKKVIWMKNFIGDLGVIPTVQDPIEILCDNESAITLTKEPKDHGKSKHTERKYHFVRSKVEEGHEIVKDIRLEDNPANLFTKALAKSKHDEHAKSIGLKDKIKF